MLKRYIANLRRDISSSSLEVLRITSLHRHFKKICGKTDMSLLKFASSFRVIMHSTTAWSIVSFYQVKKTRKLWLINFKS